MSVAEIKATKQVVVEMTWGRNLAITPGDLIKFVDAIEDAGGSMDGQVLFKTFDGVPSLVALVYRGEI
jgi:hypothetical protein